MRDPDPQHSTYLFTTEVKKSLKGVVVSAWLVHGIVADPNPSDPYVLGLLDPDPDPLVRSMDPDPYPYPSIIKQK
jgi:hypothetical protein